jgi:hypothetical protein
VITRPTTDPTLAITIEKFQQAAMPVDVSVEMEDGRPILVEIAPAASLRS